MKPLFCPAFLFLFAAASLISSEPFTLAISSQHEKSAAGHAQMQLGDLHMAPVGGLESAQKADQPIQTMTGALQSSLERDCQLEFAHLEAISYRTQVVSGTNYFIKVSHNVGFVIHVFLSTDLTCTPM